LIDNADEQAFANKLSSLSNGLNILLIEEDSKYFFFKRQHHNDEFLFKELFFK